MNTPLFTLASRALNAPSEAEYRGPSRQFLITQACLNATLALDEHSKINIPQFWRTYLGGGHEDFIRRNWALLRRQPDSLPTLIVTEFNKLAAKYQALHSFKDAGVGK